MFDPERQSTLQLQLVSKLQDELIATKTQLAQIHALTKDNPQIMPLQKKLDTLEVPMAYWGQEHKNCPVCGTQMLAAATRCRSCGTRGSR